MVDIIIPNTVEEIETSFNACRSLEKIEIPSSVKEIRVHAKKGSITGSPWGCIYGDKAIIWDE